MNATYPLNNPHTFTIKIMNGDTSEVAYTMPYSTLDEPAWDDTVDIAEHLADNVMVELTRHNWRNSNLSYDIDCHDILTDSGVPAKMLLAIYGLVQSSIANKSIVQSTHNVGEST